MLSVISVNLNGIRAAHKNGGLDWLKEQIDTGQADIVCLQEVRANDEQFLETLAAAGLDSLHVAHSASEKKGHAGVAIISNLPMISTTHGIGTFKKQGRWIEAEFKTKLGSLTVMNVYVHTGDETSVEKQKEKESFLKTMTKSMKEKASAASSKNHFLLVGDLNVGHTEFDIKNWKGNLGKAGFLESERAYFDTWFNDLAWVDLGREFAGQIPGPYTWWSWRGKAFDNDAGWRIDYQLATKHLAGMLSHYEVHRAPSYDTRWSDHAPVQTIFSK
ncbi:MAG: hypothetical protein RIS09_1193 [Actinomycetota bacterium]|jgi:exodeoxyribonuclease-3